MSKLALTLILVSGLAHGGAIEQLNRFLQTRTLSSSFVQSTTVSSKVQHSSGQLSISRPDRFRWEYTKPEPQLILGDGQKLWIYDMDLNQVSVKDQRAALGETPAALLAGSGAVNRFYTLTEKGNDQGLEWLEAQPKSREQGYAAIRMGFGGNDLKIMQLTDFTGQITHIEFSNWKKNPTLAAAQFEFVPPQGADVLRD